MTPEEIIQELGRIDARLVMVQGKAFSEGTGKSFSAGSVGHDACAQAAVEAAHNAENHVNATIRHISAMRRQIDDIRTALSR